MTEQTVAVPAQCVTFYVGDLFFGLDVGSVQEVSRDMEMTEVPLAPPVVKGLINLRGEIVTAIDLRLQLGFPGREEDSGSVSIVMRDSIGEMVNLVADEIGDVIKVDENQFEPTPDSLTDQLREYVRGVFKLEKRLLLVLSPDKVAEVYKA